MRTLSRAMLLSGLFAGTLTVPCLAEIAPDPFLIVQQGRLPIVIAAPHGGTTPLPGIAERQNLGAKRFTTSRDLHTLELAEKLAAAIELELGRAPFVVIAKFERRHVDANRPAADAFDAPGTGGQKRVYDGYHQALADARAQVQTTYGRGLLLDIHGQGRERDAISRGTQNGRTVAQLVRRSGDAAVRGPQSIVGLLAAKGYRVIPPLVAGAHEDRLEGGYTVQTYGSRDGGTVDAIQLEFGAELRKTENLDQTASDVAAAVAAFAKAYLPLEAPRRN